MPPRMEAVPYFAEAIESVLGPRLADHGFTLYEETPTEVTYRREWVFASFSHWPEDRPSPPVMVGVGLLGTDGSRRGTGLRRALTGDGPARWYETCRFRDRTSLLDVLERFVTEVVPVACEVWDSPARIATLLAECAHEAESRNLEDRRRQDLLRARRAYDGDRFQEAIDRYVLMGPESLSAGDRRRLFVARKHVPGGGASNARQDE